MKKLNKKQKTLLFIICIIAVIVIGGILAYLTDYEEKTNVFTIGKVDIELTEPKWDEALNLTKNEDPNATIPAAAQKIVPNKKIDKDPTVTNVGPTDAFVYVKVTVPKATFTADYDYDNVNNTVIIDEDHPEKYENKAQPLFSYEMDPTKWTEIFLDGDNNPVTAKPDGVTCYKETADAYIHVYYYTDATTNDILKSEASTGSMFVGDFVRFANVKSTDPTTQPVSGTKTITVDAYAIQTTGYTADEGKSLVLSTEWVKNGFAADENGKPVAVNNVANNVAP